MRADVLARRTAGCSGAQLAALVNEAALACAKGGYSSIDAAMLEAAHDKITMGAERKCVFLTRATLSGMLGVESIGLMGLHRL